MIEKMYTNLFLEKAKHKQKLSENKLSKIRSKIREHENISLSSKSSKSNIKSIVSKFI